MEVEMPRIGDEFQVTYRLEYVYSNECKEVVRHFVREQIPPTRVAVVGSRHKQEGVYRVPNPWATIRTAGESSEDFGGQPYLDVINTVKVALVTSAMNRNPVMVYWEDLYPTSSP
jgi:hypothetical protein